MHGDQAFSALAAASTQGDIALQQRAGAAALAAILLGERRDHAPTIGMGAGMIRLMRETNARNVARSAQRSSANGGEWNGRSTPARPLRQEQRRVRLDAKFRRADDLVYSLASSKRVQFFRTQ
jgi:hypothetical protein